MSSEVEKYSLEFELSIMPLTLNQVMGKHWRSRHKNFKAIKDFIHHVTKKSRPKKPIEKAHVTLWRHSSGSLDRDNSYFSAKPILDGLVQCGVLIDDGFEQIKNLDVHQVKIKRTETKKIVVQVTEV